MMMMMMMMMMKKSVFFLLVLVFSVLTEAVYEQMDVCSLSGPDALKLEQIYKTDVPVGNIWNHTGPLPGCPREFGGVSVPLNTCSVCERNERKVEARCVRARSEADLKFEGDGKNLKATCASHVTTTPAPPTTPPTTPPIRSAAPRPGLGAGVLALICAGMLLFSKSFWKKL